MMIETVVRRGGEVQGVLLRGGAQIMKNGDRWEDFLDWNARQPVPLDISDRAPDPVPEDADKSPLAQYVAKIDDRTVTTADDIAAIRRLARRLLKGL